jgi:hypothetical protein
MLIGTTLAGADQPVSSDTQAQPALAGDATGNRETYTQKTSGDMQSLQQRLHDFNRNATPRAKRPAMRQAMS